MSGFGRLLAGKPAFENPNAPGQVSGQNQPQATTTPSNGLRDASGRKIIPRVDITHLETHRNAAEMTLEAWLTNHSNLQIRLDDVTLLSHKNQVHYELAPNQSHQIILYRGPVATNDHDYRARLTFRLMANTDEFQIDYIVKFYRNPDGTYCVNQLHQEGAVRDI